MEPDNRRPDYLTIEKGDFRMCRTFVEETIDFRCSDPMAGRLLPFLAAQELWQAVKEPIW